MDPEDTRRAFGERLRDLRLQRGFGSARQFAAKLGLEENRYTRYERGEVEPSLNTLISICINLQIDPNDLFGYPFDAAKKR